MTASQITARVTPQLKKEFTKAAKQFGLPVSGLLTMFMRMVVERKFVPEFKAVNPDNLWTPQLEAMREQALKDYAAGKTIPLDVVLHEE